MFGMVNRTFAIHFRYLQKWESSRLSSSRTHVRLGAWFWSAKADIFFSESLHSTLRFGRRKTIVSQTMCALAERLSQSEIVLPLRKTCYYSPLAEVGVFSTEINKKEENAYHVLPLGVSFLFYFFTFQICFAGSPFKYAMIFSDIILPDQLSTSVVNPA